MVFDQNGQKVVFVVVNMHSNDVIVTYEVNKWHKIASSYAQT